MKETPGAAAAWQGRAPGVRGVWALVLLAWVASHMAPEEVAEVERLMGRVSKGGGLTEEEWARLERVGARTLGDGTRLVPGSGEHMAQCWVDYQFRHPRKYRRFRYEMDEEWKRMYHSILENAKAGTGFEAEVLKARGYAKNTALMMPAPGSKAQGFIPDAVKDNTEELVWGQPYHFVEVKGRKELFLSGNLQAMLSYIDAHGGHLELWLRSARHPGGRTYLSQPLKDFLEKLRERGMVTLRYFEP